MAESAKINTPIPISVMQSCVANVGGTEWLITGQKASDRSVGSGQRNAKRAQHNCRACVSLQKQMPAQQKAPRVGRLSTGCKVHRWPIAVHLVGCLWV